MESQAAKIVKSNRSQSGYETDEDIIKSPFAG
jgi:hypothetical protein